MSSSASTSSAGSGLLRSNLVVALGTALSRLTGLVRVVVFGIVIGQTALADAYNSANGSPNAVYELLLGGVLSASLVPLFTRHVEDRDDEATSAVVTVAAVMITGLTALAVLAAPWIFHLYSLNPSDGVDAGQYREVGTALTRVFLVQILFYGLTTLASALLHARRRFFAAAWAPVLSNIVIIFSLLLVPSAVAGDDPPGLADVLTNDRLRWTLGLGATLGIAIMAIALVPALLAANAPLRFSWNPRHPAVRKLVTLSGFTLGYAAANQVAVIVISNLALAVDPGAQDAYTKAYTFFVLPHGLLAVSLMTTLAPELTSRVARRDKAGFIERASLGISMVAVLTIPAGLGLFALRRPLIGALLNHGEFSAQAALTTSRALAGFALGLAGFSIYLFVLRAFYAHQDARTPFVINIGENLLNIVFGVLLVGRYGVLGLGLALALAYTIAAAWALVVLTYKVPGFTVGPIVDSLWRIVLAAVVMAEVVWFVTQPIGSNAGAGALARVVVGSVVGAAVYVGLLAALRSPELATLRDRVASRRA